MDALQGQVEADRDEEHRVAQRADDCERERQGGEAQGEEKKTMNE